MEPTLDRSSRRDRRQQPDRRVRPTTLWRALCWQGRRTGFRRTGEGHRTSVDTLAGRLVTLTVLIAVASGLEALFTLRHIQAGGSEAHPLMALALAAGPTGFVALKLGLTGMAVWWLAVHQQFPLAVRGLRGLRGLALASGLVLVSHLVLGWAGG